jgi:hypothetical protein
MTEPLGGLPTDAKIIIGVEDADDTGWYSLHLHDAPYAVSVRPDEKSVVIAEGKGPGRLRYLRYPFENIFRFEAVKVPIGHDLRTGAGETFAPVMLRLIIKHRDRQNFVSIRDLGATPLPTLASLLNATAEGNTAGDGIVSKSTDDCFTLAAGVAAWVANVNAEIKGAAAVSQERRTRPSRQEVKRKYEKLDRSLPDVLQTLVSAYAAIYVSIKLYKELRLVKPVRIRSSFPLNLTPEEAANKPPHYSAIEQLYAVSERYHEETNRPIEEAYEIICEQIDDLAKRDVTINSSEKLKFLKDNAPKSIPITEPDTRINERLNERLNEKRRRGGGELIDKELFVLDGHELRHEDRLRKVFDNEGVSIHYLENLPFLSLLVQYETEGGGSRYAVVIKDEARPALKDFLLSHEMGHLFSHIYEDIHSTGEARSEKLRLFLRSSADENTFLEHEANEFGMAVLFPPAYLADREIFSGALSVEALLEEFLQGKDPGPKLRAQMRRRIGEHIERYKEFKKDTSPRSLTLEVKRIEEKDLDLLKLVAEPYYWIKLSKKSDILEVSENCVGLFGRPKEEIKALKPGDLVIKAERERMRKRAEHREKNKTAIFYITEIWNEREQTSRQVAVYSFPILRDGEYVGAMAALKALDEIEAPSTGALPNEGAN